MATVNELTSKEISKVADYIAEKNSILDQIGVLNDKDKNFYRGYYVIPNESTELYRFQREGADYTVLEIASPDDTAIEATLSLMRSLDPVTGGPEFLDFYNNGYSTMKQYGIRIQKRGTGQYNDFVFDFYDGTTVNEALRIRKDTEVEFYDYIHVQKYGNQHLYFRSGNGAELAHLGRVNSGTQHVVLMNSNVGIALKLMDSGELLYNEKEVYHEGNTTKGKATFSGDGLATSFTIAHGLGVTPSFYQVQEASVDAGAAEINYVLADTTNITVHFKAAPTTGTSNIGLTWMASV